MIRASRTRSCSCRRSSRCEERMTPILEVANVSKSFTMHLRGGVVLPVVRDVSFSVAAGECVVLAGPSGIGKSSILKMIFGSYRCDHGTIRVHHAPHCTEGSHAAPRAIIALRGP